jgi:hypothetical protein
VQCPDGWRKHTRRLFGRSGHHRRCQVGQEVLLRHIVEEAALAGIPAIVIDANNHLPRLGDV